MSEIIHGSSDKKINYSQAIGDLAEGVVQVQLGDEERVSQILGSWRSSQQGKDEARKGGAANNPDWLVLNEEGLIVSLVEVKAQSSDTATINQKRVDFVTAWKEFPEMVAEMTDWERRVDRVWQDKGSQFLFQMRQHAVRAIELAHTGVIGLANDFSLILYVPEDQKFGEWPAALNVGRGSDQRLVALEVRKLPSLGVLDQQLADQGITRPQAPSGESQSPAGDVRQRIEGMKTDFEIINETLQMDKEEFEEWIKKLMYGDSHTAVTDEKMLQLMNSTQPSLAAHVLFVMNGEKLAGMSREEKAKVQKWCQESGVGSDFGERLLGTLGKMREPLRKKPVRLADDAGLKPQDAITLGT